MSGGSRQQSGRHWMTLRCAGVACWQDWERESSVQAGLRWQGATNPPMRGSQGMRVRCWPNDVSAPVAESRAPISRSEVRAAHEGTTREGEHGGTCGECMCQVKQGACLLQCAARQACLPVQWPAKGGHEWAHPAAVPWAPAA